MLHAISPYAGKCNKISLSLTSRSFLLYLHPIRTSLASLQWVSLHFIRVSWDSWRHGGWERRRKGGVWGQFYSMDNDSEEFVVFANIARILAAIIWLRRERCQKVSFVSPVQGAFLVICLCDVSACCSPCMILPFDTEQNGVVHYKKLSNFIRSPIFPWHVTSKYSNEKFVKRYQLDSKVATSSQSPCNARSRGNFKPDGGCVSIDSYSEWALSLGGATELRHQPPRSKHVPTMKTTSGPNSRSCSASSPIIWPFWIFFCVEDDARTGSADATLEFFHPFSVQRNVLAPVKVWDRTHRTGQTQMIHSSRSADTLPHLFGRGAAPCFPRAWEDDARSSRCSTHIAEGDNHCGRDCLRDDKKQWTSPV